MDRGRAQGWSAQLAVVVRRRRTSERREARPGFVLSFQGADIGVVERIEATHRDGVPRLRVRGGVSGCLEYVIPTSAIVCVQLEERRAQIHDDVVFEAEQVGDDGRVLLVAHIETSDADRPV